MTDQASGHRIRWWRHDSYEWCEGIAGDWIRPAAGAVLQEYSLGTKADDWQEAAALARTLEAKPGPLGLPYVHTDNRDVVLNWCAKYGLPGSGLVDAIEIALPEVEVEAEHSYEEQFERTSYVRVGAYWETRRSMRLRDYREGTDSQEGPIWPAGGAVRWAAPGDSWADTRPLHSLQPFFPGCDLQSLPCPLTKAAWAGYVEPEQDLVHAFRLFDRAVKDILDEKNATGLSQYLAGTSWCAIPRVKPLPRSKWLAGWQVSSLFAAFAIQVLMLVGDARLLPCGHCGIPVAARNKRRKWCEDCQEAGRKAEQRRKAREAAAGGTSRD